MNYCSYLLDCCRGRAGREGFGSPCGPRRVEAKVRAEFVQRAQLINCFNNNIALSSSQCNKTPELIRNVFGGSLGGPIKKKRAYFFLNYEGQRRAEAQSAVRTVPTDSLKDGIIFYQCDSSNPASATQCPGGSVPD